MVGGMDMLGDAERAVAAAEAVVLEAGVFIARHGLLTPGEAVVAAVSGGGDSVALLGILLELGHPVTAAHLDHGTRGGESAEDAVFVAGLCGRLGVELVLERIPVDRERQRGESFETAARRIRYGFLERVSAERGLAVATGHQAEDQAETVVMRQRRGAGARGLSGMAPCRPLGRSRLIRPLLSCRREALRGYLRARGLGWREDVTNADPTAAQRNRVRQELSGAAAEGVGDPVAVLWGAAEASRRSWEAALEALDRARALSGLLAPEAGALDLARVGLERLDPELRRVWWLLWMEALGYEPSRARVERLEEWFLRGRTGSRCPLGRAGMAVLGRDRVIVVPDGAGGGQGDPGSAAEEELKGLSGEARLGGWRLRWTVRAVTATERARPREACGPFRQLLDADRPGGTVRARFYRAGDRIRPLGMGGRSRKLQDYFTDRGVPVPERGRIPVVESGGEIVWVAGYGPSETARVTDETRVVLDLEAFPPGGTVSG